MKSVTISQEEYESLKKDKERLDFLESCHRKLPNSYVGGDSKGYGWKVVFSPNVIRLMTTDHKSVDLHDTEGGDDKEESCRFAIDTGMLQMKFYGRTY